VKDLEAALKGMKVDVVAETVSVRHVPGPEALEKCHELGRTVASELAKRLSQK